MGDIHENLIPIVDYQVLGKLPDLFTMEDGTPVTDQASWERRRKELYKTAVEPQYGTIPPDP